MGDQFEECCLAEDFIFAGRMQVRDSYPYAKLFLKAYMHDKIRVANWLFNQYHGDNEWCHFIHIIATTFVHACKNGNVKWLEWLYCNMAKQIDVNRLFMDVCRNKQLRVAQWLLHIYPEIQLYNRTWATKLFHYICLNQENNIVAMWLYSIAPYIDFSYNNEYTFQYACVSGNIEFAKWLYDKHKFGNINRIFHRTCQNNHLETAHWLFQINKDNDAKNAHMLMKLACENNNIDMVKWLVTIIQGNIKISRDEYLAFNVWHNNFAQYDRKIKETIFDANIVNPSYLTRPDLEYYLSITDRFVPQNFKTVFTDIPVKRRGDHTKPALH